MRLLQFDLPKLPTVVTLLTVSAALPLVSCVFSGPTTEVKLGYIGTYTGASAATGLHSRDGAELAIKHWNEKHPRFKLVASYVDDRGDPARAIGVFDDLKQAGTEFFIGPLLTSTAEVLALESFKSHALFIGPLIAGANLANRDDYFLRLFPTTTQIGEAIRSFLVSRKLGRIAVVSAASNREYSLSIFDAVAQAKLKSREIELIDHARFDDSVTKALDRQIAGWKAKGVEALVLLLPVQDILRLCARLAATKSRFTLVTAPWGVDPSLLGEPGTEGLFGFLPIDLNSRDEAYLRFVADYQAEYGRDASFASVLNYEAVGLMAEGLIRAKQARPAMVKHWILEQKGFRGLQSMISIDATGDVQRNLFLHQIAGKTFITIPKY